MDDGMAKAGEEIPAKSGISGEMTFKEREAMFKGTEPFKKAKPRITVSPYFSVMEVKDGGKMKKIPMFGIKGTF